MSLITDTIATHSKDNDKVSVFLRNGVQLTGVITDTDEDAFNLVSTTNESSLVLIDAVAAIKKWTGKTQNNLQNTR